MQTLLCTAVARLYVSQAGCDVGHHRSGDARELRHVVGDGQLWENQLVK